jgi:hypothetical protein
MLPRERVYPAIAFQRLGDTRTPADYHAVRHGLIENDTFDSSLFLVFIAAEIYLFSRCLATIWG